MCWNFETPWRCDLFFGVSDFFRIQKLNEREAPLDTPSMCVQVWWTPTYYQGVPTFSPNGSDWFCWGSVNVDSAPRVLSGAVSGYVACIRGEWWFSAVPAHAALVRPSLVISPKEKPPRSTKERSQRSFAQRLLIPGSKMCVFDWKFVSFSPTPVISEEMA